MSLRYWYRDPALGYAVFTDITDRCRYNPLSFEERLEEGAPATSTLIIDDPDGDFVPHAHRSIGIEETDAEDPENTFIGVGFVSDIRLVRGSHHRTGHARQWEVDVQDPNTILSRYIMIGNDNDRPAETDVARVQWAEGTAEADAIQDTRYLSTADPVNMDANDYLLQELIAVFEDTSQQSGKNYGVTYFGDVGVDDPNPWGYWSLWYGDAGSTDYQSIARLTTVIADQDPFDDYEPTFYMSIEDELRVDGSRIFSRVVVPYKNAYSYADNSQTRADYARRETVMAAPNVSTATTALARARRYVRDLATPDYTATVSCIVPRAKVNVIRPGMAVQVYATHWVDPLPDEYTFMRVLSRRVDELSADDDQTYKLTLELTYAEAAPTAAGCAGLTESGSFYPLGGSGSFPNPSGGNLLYCRPGISCPTVPTPGHEGRLHFAVYGAGGVGTVDYGGDCVQNHFRCIVVGDGTMVIHSETYSGSPRNLQATLYHDTLAGPVADEVQHGTTGDDFTFEVSTHGGVNCTHWVDLRDQDTTCGGKFGCSGFDWTAA